MRPAGDQFQWYAGAAQLVDARGIGMALAPQHQQRFDGIALAGGVDQLHCDLGGTTGETAGDEVQDADLPCAGRWHQREAVIHACPGDRTAAGATTTAA